MGACLGSFGAALFDLVGPAEIGRDLERQEVQIGVRIVFRLRLAHSSIASRSA